MDKLEELKIRCEKIKVLVAEIKKLEQKIDQLCIEIGNLKNNYSRNNKVMHIRKSK